MNQLVQVSVENEMDLILAYKKSIKAAELLGLSISTQTAFATAVSEVCREVIDKTHDGLASIEIHNDGERLSLAAVITYKESPGMGNLEGGMQYARKLIPVFNSSVSNGLGMVQLKLSIPRSSGLTKAKILIIGSYFSNVEPATPYEEVRQRNLELFQINEQAEIALKQAEYLNQQKTEFLSVASHELKTPLTILRAFTQLALKSECSPQAISHLKKVDVQALKIQMLIQQLLDISKIENGKPDYNKEVLDLNDYLGNIFELMYQMVPGHELLIKLGDTQPVLIDKLRMEQVITNIVGNAAKYSPMGTPIEVSTSLLPTGEVLFKVKDQGIGMSKEELDKVFGKFYRVESVTKSFNGLGMGLYISSKIINDHGGKIWVESIEGQGSVFCFSIPVYTS